MGTGTGRKLTTKKQLVSLTDSLGSEAADLQDLDLFGRHIAARQQRLEAIRAQVRAGTYRADELAVARAILKRSL